MNFDTALAKKYFQYDTSKSTEFEAILNNCLTPAENRFRSKIEIKEYNRFFNYSEVTATSKETDNITFNYDSSISEIKVNDIIVIDDIMFTIVETDDDKFVIDKEYIGSELVTINKTMKIYNSLFAWYVLYYFYIIGKELFIGNIIPDNIEFGDGSQSSAKSILAKDKKEIIENINSEYSSILVNQSPIELGRM